MTTLHTPIEVVINGDPQEIPAGSTVTQLLQQLGVEAERVAVELDRTIIRRAAWETTEIRPGAKLEIVHFVGGG